MVFTLEAIPYVLSLLYCPYRLLFFKATHCKCNKCFKKFKNPPGMGNRKKSILQVWEISGEYRISRNLVQANPISELFSLSNFQWQMLKKSGSLLCIWLENNISSLFECFFDVVLVFPEYIYSLPKSSIAQGCRRFAPGTQKGTHQPS